MANIKIRKSDKKQTGGSKKQAVVNKKEQKVRSKKAEKKVAEVVRVEKVEKKSVKTKKASVSAKSTKAKKVVGTPVRPIRRAQGEQASVGKAQDKQGKPQTMEELLAATGYELKAPKRGEAISGVITDISKKMVLVDIGGKTEGMVVDKEYEAARDLVTEMSIGNTITVYVVSPENDRGQILLSLKRAAMERKWEQFDEYLKTGETVTVKGLEVNRGGLIVQADNMRGFVPSSQFSKDYLGRMDRLLNKSFKVKVIEVDREKNRLIFSERHVSEADAMAQKAAALKQVKEKDVYEGVVSGIMPFGVFVTVEVPLQKSGDKTQGDPSTARRSTSARRAQDDKAGLKSVPALSNKPGEAKVAVGQVEGLVHISEISWEKVDDPNRYFRVGDRVKVLVLGVNEDSGKLNLSVKRLTPDPWSDIDKRYGVGSKVAGKVTRVAPFGVFVTLEPGVDGLIHISKIPAGGEPKVGSEIDVFVESVEPTQRRMSLGMVLTEVPVGYK